MQPAPTPVDPVQPRPEVELSVPAHINDVHPQEPPVKNAAPAGPPASVPIYTVTLPPLTFSSSSPLPPPDPPIDTVLLAREAHVDPEWQFGGRVEPPEFARAMQLALGEGGEQSQPPQEPPKKRRGFWASLRKFFSGSGAGE